MTASEVYNIVEQEVTARQPRRFKLFVSKEGIVRDGDWWHVVVRPDQSDIRAYDYSRLMSKIEREIEKRDHIKVLLVPTLQD